MRLVDQIQQNVQKFAIDQHGTQIDTVEIQPTKKDHDRIVETQQIAFRACFSLVIARSTKRLWSSI